MSETTLTLRVVPKGATMAVAFGKRKRKRLFDEEEPVSISMLSMREACL
jgi:hypothetical protein